MKKFLLSLLLLLQTYLFSQMDTEHYLAPMVNRSNTLSRHQSLYFSTNVATPFPVSIFSNNTLIGTVTISKGSPQKFDVPIDKIITNQDSDLYRPVNMGLYTKGDHPYFANFRFSIFNHGEFISLKGKAALGKKFYAAPAENNVGLYNINAMISVLATEDNTTVNISGYNPNVIFSDGSSSPTKTFVLNKGESYILDAISEASGDNLGGLIGAKIVSDKPITVTNGNFNGQYVATFLSSSDILMDQSLPVERLGSEFAIVKGNGDVKTNIHMEEALIVATEDNTDVYINNSSSPVIRLNEGGYYIVKDNNYVDQGFDHYNLYIRTTKNVYVYQFLQGAKTSSPNLALATGGMNYIPPLNCYLPKTIDEIGMIDENLVVTNTSPPEGFLNIPTKLNIITHSGATVKVNGQIPLPTQGPFNLRGNNQWVTYSIPDVSGNITVTSTEAVTAGISAGSDAVGYGGYFGGFSSIPFLYSADVSNSGDCFPGIILSVNPSNFSTYQWRLNGVDIAGAKSPTYTPTQIGNYSLVVSTHSCPPIETAPFKVLNCPFNNTINKISCGSFSFYPIFANSTQTPDPASISITSQPTKGTVFVDYTIGLITYTQSPNTNGTDTFTFNFKGINNFPDSQNTTVVIDLKRIDPIDTQIKACNINGYGTFDLSTAEVTLQTPVTKKYYKTLLAAQNEDSSQEILNYTHYNAQEGSVYVNIKNTYGCSAIAKISLIFYKEDELPKITAIDIQQSTVTIYASGGTPPLLYSLDGINYQSSNIFTDVSSGNNTAYVISKENCLPAVKDFVLIQLLNVITPNGDGINDSLDYTSLRTKSDVKFSVFDRYGKLIYTDNGMNNYKWDGKISGAVVPSGTYWYMLEWKEFGISTPVKYNNWVLVKPR